MSASSADAGGAHHRSAPARIAWPTAGACSAPSRYSYGPCSAKIKAPFALPESASIYSHGRSAAPNFTRLRVLSVRVDRKKRRHLARVGRFRLRSFFGAGGERKMWRLLASRAPLGRHRNGGGRGAGVPRHRRRVAPQTPLGFPLGAGAVALTVTRRGAPVFSRYLFFYFPRFRRSLPHISTRVFTVFFSLSNKRTTR